SGALYLLSLVPGVSVGLGAMQSMLFEERPFGFTGNLERMLMRVLHDSPEYRFGWARRSALVREFRTRVIQDARKAGVTGSDGEIGNSEMADIVHGRNIPRAAQLLKESLDAIGVDTKAEDEARK